MRQFKNQKPSTWYGKCREAIQKGSSLFSTTQWPWSKIELCGQDIFLVDLTVYMLQTHWCTHNSQLTPNFQTPGRPQSSIVKRLGLGLGTWDLGPGTWDLGIELRIENRNSPSAVLTVKSHDPPTHPPPPTTFRGEGDKLQQSAFSKNVSGWSPKPIQHKKLPGGQRE